jgi:hypothetical protein
MRRALVLVVVLVMGLMAFAGSTAAAPQPGCPAFGQAVGPAVAGAAQNERPLGQEVSAEAPLSDELGGFKAFLCS